MHSSTISVLKEQYYKRLRLSPTVQVTSVEDEHGIIHGESNECDWCGVTFTNTPHTTKRKSSCYCSLDCSRTGDFLAAAIVLAIGFLGSIAALIVEIPDKTIEDRIVACVFGVILVFIGLFLSHTIWKIRRRIPKDSRKGQYLDSDIG